MRTASFRMLAWLVIVVMGRAAWAQEGAASETLRAATTLDSMPVSVNDLCISPRGILACALSDNNVEIWDVKLRTRQILKGHLDEVMAVAFYPTGDVLASGGGDGTVKIWDVAQRKEMTTLDIKDEIFGLAFSADKRLLVAATGSGLRSWTSGTWKPAKLEDKEWCVGVAFSPDSKTLAVTGVDGTLRLWDCATAKVRRQVQAHPKFAMKASFSLDGAAVATTSMEDKAAKVWDAESGKELASVAIPAGVLAVSYAPGGKTFLTGSSDGSIQVWSHETHEKLSEIKGVHAKGEIQGFAFLPGGSVASCGVDGTIKISKLPKP